MFDMKEIGKRISTLRKKKGLTQMELANKFGISFQAVSNWERGTAMPDISNLTELATALDSTVDYILGDEKTARVLADLESGNVPDKSITPEEFNNIAPLLPPEKNDLLINSVNNQFSDEEAEKAKPNLGFGGEYDDSDDNLARKAFDNNQVAMFSILLSGISDGCAAELFAKAQERNSLPFIALLMRRVTREDKRNLARKAFEDNNIAVFSMTKQYLTPEDISFYRQKAFENGNIAFFAVLSAKVGSSHVHVERNKSESGNVYRDLKAVYRDKKAEYTAAKEKYRSMKDERADEDALDEQEEVLDRIEEEMDGIEEKMDNLEDQ